MECHANLIIFALIRRISPGEYIYFCTFISEMDDVKEIVRKIRKDIRLSMDGMISTSMRQKGMHYRLNFGVPIPRLREIAVKYIPDKVLSENLWEQSVRELKILSTLLYPVDDFSEVTAMSWIEGVPNQEIREQLCINLLQNLKFAGEIVSNCIIHANSDVRITGYWLFSRLVIIKSDSILDIHIDHVLKMAMEDVISEPLFLRQASLQALRYSMRISKEMGGMILLRLAFFKNSEEELKREIYDILHFEFDVLFNF